MPQPVNRRATNEVNPIATHFRGVSSIGKRVFIKARLTFTRIKIIHLPVPAVLIVLKMLKNRYDAFPSFISGYFFRPLHHCSDDHTEQSLKNYLFIKV